MLNSSQGISCSSTKRTRNHSSYLEYTIIFILILSSVFLLQHVSLSDTPDVLIEKSSKLELQVAYELSSINKRSVLQVNPEKAATWKFQEGDIIHNSTTGLLVENIILNNQRLALLNCTDAVIRNVTVNTSYWGMIIDQSSNILIDNCTVIDGINAIGTTNVTINECTIKESEIYYGNIGIKDCSDVSIKHNTLFTTHLDVTDSSNTTISSNSFLEGKSQSNKIMIQGCDNITVSNNMLVPATGGIQIFEATNLIITGNTVDSAQGLISLTIWSSTSIVVSGNNLSNAKTYGIESKANNQINITGNSLKNIGTGIVFTTTNTSRITENDFNRINSYALSIGMCNDLLYSANVLNNTDKALFFSNSSTYRSREIEITDNHYWNLVGKFALISGDVTLGPGSLYIHDNYLDGQLFNGIPEVTTASTTTMTLTTTSKTVAIAVIPFLLAITGKIILVMIKRRRKY